MIFDDATTIIHLNKIIEQLNNNFQKIDDRVGEISGEIFNLNQRLEAIEKRMTETE